MADLFSSTDSDDGLDEWTDPDDPSDFEDDDDVSAVQHHTHFGQAVLVSPPQPQVDISADEGDISANTDWNAAARLFLREQKERRLCYLYVLLRCTNLSKYQIYGIMQLAPVTYTGRQAIPGAHSSVFKVHFYQDKMGLILLTSGQLYAVDLKTGQFWHDDRDYSITRYLNRVRAATFHPTRPLVFIHHQSWSPGFSLKIIRYPTSLAESGVPQRTGVDVDAVSPRGLSAVGPGVLTFHSGTRRITLHDVDRPFDTGITRSRTLSHLTQSHAVYFAKLLGCTPDRCVLCWQTQVGSSQQPLRVETLAPATQTTTHLYGPTSTIYDVVQSEQHVVAATKKHTIHVWLADGTLCKTIRRHHGIIQSIALSKTVLMSASFDKSVRIWDLATFRQVTTGNADKYMYTGQKRKPQAIALRDGRVLIGFDDKTIDVYRI